MLVNHTTVSTSGERLHYWNTVAQLLLERQMDTLWRAHSDAVNTALIGRWLPGNSVQRLLKTDLFDEALGQGLYPLFAWRIAHVVGVDLAHPILKTAAWRYPKLLATGADVRQLPLADSVFDLIISNSTLDHFDSLADLAASLRELQRVLQRGGYIMLNIDNRANPIIRLRNSLPFRLLNKLCLVPYHLGATCGPRRLRGILVGLGFEVLESTAVLHCSRILAVKLAHILEKRTNCAIQQGFLRQLMSFEQLAHWATRFLTGCYVPVLARRNTQPLSPQPVRMPS
jgi:SAM-dependent methyltransferase